jgi:phosphoribosylanthranilate isomerase
MKIKVCGMKNPENIKAVAQLQPDYMGFICYNLSPRYMAALPTDVLEMLPPSICKTGVFVNEEIDTIKSLINKFGFTAVQLHGSESPAFCDSLRGKVTVLKAFGVDDSFDFNRLQPYAGHVDYLMFDTKTVNHGGSGQAFNWDVIQQYTLDIPFFICGGLGPDNLKKVKQIKHPALYGVDLNSRFETEPGMKDIKQLQQAFNTIRTP